MVVPPAIIVQVSCCAEKTRQPARFWAAAQDWVCDFQTARACLPLDSYDLALALQQHACADRAQGWTECGRWTEWRPSQAGADVSRSIAWLVSCFFPLLLGARGHARSQNSACARRRHRVNRRGPLSSPAPALLRSPAHGQRPTLIPPSGSAARQHSPGLRDLRPAPASMFLLSTPLFADRGR